MTDNKDLEEVQKMISTQSIRFEEELKQIQKEMDNEKPIRAGKPLSKDFKEYQKNMDELNKKMEKEEVAKEKEKKKKMTKCNVCNKNIISIHMSRHVKTEAHKNKVTKNEENSTHAKLDKILEEICKRQNIKVNYILQPSLPAGPMSIPTTTYGVDEKNKYE